MTERMSVEEVLALVAAARARRFDQEQLSISGDQYTRLQEALAHYLEAGELILKGEELTRPATQLVQEGES